MYNIQHPMYTIQKDTICAFAKPMWNAKALAIDMKVLKPAWACYIVGNARAILKRWRIPVPVQH